MAKFKGDFEDLHKLVVQTGTPGFWRELPNGQIQFRSVCGAVLNWWPTTGTITVQGKPVAVDELKFALAALVIGRTEPCTVRLALTRPRRSTRRHLLSPPAGRSTSPRKP